jgi:hypothetical protein
LVLILASIYTIRFLQTLAWWDFLTELPRVSPLYLALSGLIWALIGLPLSWGLWRGSAPAAMGSRFIAPAYAVFYWFERLFITRAGSNFTNWPFAAGMTVLLLAFVFWTLSRPQSRRFFAIRSVRANDQPIRSNYP